MIELKDLNTINKFKYYSEINSHFNYRVIEINNSNIKIIVTEYFGKYKDYYENYTYTYDFESPGSNDQDEIEDLLEYSFKVETIQVLL